MTEQPDLTISSELAQFAYDFDLNNVPNSVQQYALHLILDATGIAYAASQYDFSKKGLEALRLFNEQGEHIVLGTREKNDLP
jgi:hypothetical protein